MRSNEVARMAGVSVRTLRHYHALGLLPEPPRAANGYRDYAPADVARVLRIRRLASLGFPLARVGAVMEEMDAGAEAADDPLAELDRELEQEISRLELMRAGMRVGRDMMGTDSNTLILAFAGTSLSMLVLDYAYELPYLQIINSNNIGIAVMQGLSGSFGVVLTVPATVLMAAYIYKGENG